MLYVNYFLKKEETFPSSSLQAAGPQLGQVSQGGLNGM